MKKVCLLLVISFILCSCGTESVSNEEYNKVVTESNELKEEFESISQETDETQNRTNITEKIYYIGDDSFSFSFSKIDDEYEINIWCSIENKSDAYLVNVDLLSMLRADDPDAKKIVDMISCIIMVGDGSSITYTPEVYSIMCNGMFTSSDEYFSYDWIQESSEELDESEYGGKVIGFMNDFLKNECVFE